MEASRNLIVLVCVGVYMGSCVFILRCTTGDVRYHRHRVNDG